MSINSKRATLITFLGLVLLAIPTSDMRMCRASELTELIWTPVIESRPKATAGSEPLQGAFWRDQTLVLDSDGALHVEKNGTWKAISIPGLLWPAQHPLAVTKDEVFVLGASIDSAAVWASRDLVSWEKTALAYSQPRESLAAVTVSDGRLVVVGYEKPMSWEIWTVPPDFSEQRGYRIWDFSIGDHSGGPVLLTDGGEIDPGAYPVILEPTDGGVFIGGYGSEGTLLVEYRFSGAISSLNTFLPGKFQITEVLRGNASSTVFGIARGTGFELYSDAGEEGVAPAASGLTAYRSGDADSNSWIGATFQAGRISDNQVFPPSHHIVSDSVEIGGGVVAVGTAQGAGGAVWVSNDGSIFLPATSDDRSFGDVGYVDVVVYAEDRVVLFGKVAQTSDEAWGMWTSSKISATCDMSKTKA